MKNIIDMLNAALDELRVTLIERDRTIREQSEYIGSLQNTIELQSRCLTATDATIRDLRADMSAVETRLVIISGKVADWGIIPTFLDPADPRSAAEQIDANYVGGWRHFEGFTFDFDSLTLHYTGDPPLRLLSALLFRKETLLLYPYDWVLILQPDKSWQIARLD